MKSFLKALFGGSAKARGEPLRKSVLQGEVDPPIPIDPSSISHAFVTLTHTDLAHFDQASSNVASFNKRSQPRLWALPFDAKFGSFAASAAAEGYPDVNSVPVALREVGLGPQSSIVINNVVVSFDSGKTNSKILVGFAFLDDFLPRVIFPRTDGCVPTYGLQYDRAPGGSLYAFYERMSHDLIAQHGPLVRVKYASHYPLFEIWFCYQDGTEIYSGQRRGRYDIHFLSLGYAGEGPTYAQSFLEAAGFELTYAQVESVRPGDTIELVDGEATVVRHT